MVIKSYYAHSLQGMNVLFSSAAYPTKNCNNEESSNAVHCHDDQYCHSKLSYIYGAMIEEQVGSKSRFEEWRLECCLCWIFEYHFYHPSTCCEDMY